jgi:hypothetical protein
MIERSHLKQEPVRIGRKINADDTMNKIVLEHYPVSMLPDDLRDRFPENAKVRMVIEEEMQAQTGMDNPYPGFDNLPVLKRQPMTIDETLAAIRRIRAEGRPSATAGEAVARVRALRDEWDD